MAITIKIKQDKRQDKTNVIYWYDILKDGAPIEEACQITRTPEMTEEEVANQLRAIKVRYEAAEAIVEQEEDPLLGMEI